jgi:hypothetical protein
MRVKCTAYRLSDFKVYHKCYVAVVLRRDAIKAYMGRRARAPRTVALWAGWRVASFTLWALCPTLCRKWVGPHIKYVHGFVLIPSHVLATNSPPATPQPVSLMASLAPVKNYGWTFKYLYIAFYNTHLFMQKISLMQDYGGEDIVKRLPEFSCTGVSGTLCAAVHLQYHTV